jgi:hypothetical protein
VTGGAGAEVDGEPEEELPPLWARERTMSFLQIGQVRRRVVSHGVLVINISLAFNNAFERTGWKNLHARFVELVAAGQAHNTADAIDILFQTDHAFTLLATVTAPPFCQA